MNYRWLIKRILIIIPIFIVITFFVYVMINLAPGGPLSQLQSSGTLTKEQLHAMEKALGLDKPLIARYFIWLWNLLKGDMGVSYSTSRPVADTLFQRLPPTLILSGASLIVAVIIGVTIGVFSALKPYSVIDRVGSAIAFLGSSVPGFLLSLGLIYIFAVRIKVLPSMGMYYSSKPKNLSNLAIHLILPAFIVGFGLIGGLIKQTRGSTLETLNEEYVKTARAKGIRESSVIVQHALRNALIPVVTSVGLMVPYLISGTVVVEQIFSWPGVGSLLVQSITTRDYPMIMGAVVVIALVVLVTNTVLDLLYGIIDPRISRAR